MIFLYLPFVEVKDHALLRWASELPAARAHLQAHLALARLGGLVDAIPTSLRSDERFGDEEALREAYRAWLQARLTLILALAAEEDRAHAARYHAIVCVVPRVERDEFISVGVALFCADPETLVARMALDEARLRALAPGVDVALIRAHLDASCRICLGGPEAGTIGALPTRERWRWRVAPHSTIL